MMRISYTYVPQLNNWYICEQGPILYKVSEFLQNALVNLNVFSFSELLNKLWIVCSFYFLPKKRFPSWLYLCCLTIYLVLRNVCPKWWFWWVFQIVYAANLRQYSRREQRQWVCLQNDMKDHVGPSNSVVSSVAGGEYILEMCQQLQLNCYVKIWDFPILRRRNSFS